MTLKELKARADELNIDTETVKGYGKLSAKSTWEDAINDREIEMMDDAEMAEIFEENALLDAEENTLESSEIDLESADLIIENVTSTVNPGANKVDTIPASSEKIFSLYDTSDGLVPHNEIGGLAFAYAPACTLPQTRTSAFEVSVEPTDTAVQAVEVPVDMCADIPERDNSEAFAVAVDSTHILNHAMPMVLMITAVFVVCYQVYYGLYVPVRRWTVPRAKAIWRDLYSLVNMVDVGFIIQ